MRYIWLAAVTLMCSAGVLSAQDYVGSGQCTDCHTEAARAWRGSHHALAWTKPSADTIVGDFNGTEFAHDGMTARFRIDELGDYRINVTEKDGTTRDYPVHSVAGIEPLQQYLLETEPGRLQSFDVVWDTERGAWYHLYPDQDLPPDDGLHWTGPYKTWNSRCAECHATGFEKNFDAATRSYASTQVEMGVGCEACHGPGGDHLRWANALKTTQTAPPANYGFTADFSNAEATIQQCATCHSRREAYLDGNPLPGTPYHQSYNLSLLQPGLYHSDGQILDEVYVYGSFLQSRMYAKGVSCVNCHNPHSADLIAEGNAVCTQCHSPAGNPEFPTLTPAEYDSTKHHFHEQGSTGAQCKSCHMVERAYMGNDWRADHSFRIPRPDLDKSTGAPDACTTCHTDQSAEWAANQIAAWYPDSNRRGDHYGTVLARGSRNAVAASGDLTKLALDRRQPGVVRATALWLLQQSNSPSAATDVLPLLQDLDPLVRRAVMGVQGMLPSGPGVAGLSEALVDPVPGVRHAAALALLNIPLSRAPESVKEDMRSALADWHTALGNRLDFPETQLQLGGIALTMRNLPAAQAAFGEVVAMDPQRSDAWIMLARIASVMGQEERVRQVLSDALAANPDDPAPRAMAGMADEPAPGLLPTPD